MSKKVRYTYYSDYGTVDATRSSNGNGSRARLKRKKTGKTRKQVEQSRRNGSK